MTELDDLKSTWQTLNRTLERQHTLAFHQSRESKLERLRSGFRPLVIGQVIQIICGLLLSICGGSFWFDHIGVAHLMFYGISLHAYGVMLIVFAARDLFLIQRLDYGAPVLALQKQIAGLRDWHLRCALWFAVAGCFIWVPLVLLIFHGLGADVWQRAPEVVGWFFLSSVVCLAVLLGIIASRRRPGGEKLDASSTGRSVTRAQALLAEIERFEQE
ncbi:MAG: hypothetical protein H0X34_11825 [Chthoniobacterales bacterium]|nr:hypothetical protein [Chthoniobacterales bacterium]